MSNYLIDLMTWSYSRLHAYHDCPYKFYLKYIERLEEKPMWFSGYGTLMHGILADFYTEKLARDEAELAYLSRFRREVPGRPPSPTIFQNYFQQGLAYCKAIQPSPYKILKVESNVRFELDGYRFTGFIDLLGVDDEGGLHIVDHKSRDLKPRSTRGKKTVADRTLDEYLRQLYLYSIPVATGYSRQPVDLVFNCFRKQNVMVEPFRAEGLEEAKVWALDTIHAIEKEKDWVPNCDPWKCRHLCGLCDQCEYSDIT